MSTERKYNVSSDDPNFNTDAFIDYMAAQPLNVKTLEFYDGQTHCVVNGSIVSIASLTAAAPEMLEALQQSQSFIREITEINGKYSYLNSRINGTVIISDAYSALRTIESAIAKAKGEQP